MQTDTRFDWDAATERERDARVGRLVMGLEVLPQFADVGDPDCGESVWPDPHEWTEPRPVFVAHCHCDSPIFGADNPDPCESVRARVAFKERHGHKASCCEPLPHYTTDPAAAWGVMRKVREEWDHDQKVKFHVKTKQYAGSRLPPPVHLNHVLFGPMRLQDPWLLWLEPADICRAALSVMEEQDAR